MSLRVVAKWIGGPIAVVALLLCGPLLTLAFGPVSASGDWRSATHRPTGLAPDPAILREPIVQVYASRTFGWRGAFAVHTWIVAKPADAERYTRYEVIGWRARGGGSALSISDSDAPDAEWFGQPPTLLAEVRGPAAAAVIARLPEAAQSYPYAHRYVVWPGPNSNTFVAHVARRIPELGLVMPAIAIGKDYLPFGDFSAAAPSGSGWQVSLGGLVGATLARDEGIELDVLGLVVGVGAKPFGLKLPGIGEWPARAARPAG